MPRSRPAWLGKSLRLTYIPDPSYDKRPAVRIVIVNSEGRVRQGPEIPVELLDDVEVAFKWVREQAAKAKSNL